MSPLKCCLCFQPSTAFPDYFKTVLRDLIRVFNNTQSFRVQCIKLDTLPLCKPCWNCVMQVHQFDHELRLKKETCDAKKAFLSSKIRRAQRSLAESGDNQDSCQDFEVHSPAGNDSEDSEADLEVSGTFQDDETQPQASNEESNSSMATIEDIPRCSPQSPSRMSLKSTADSETESIKLYEVTDVITPTADSSSIAASSAEEVPAEATSEDMNECHSESEPANRKTLVDNMSTSAISPDKEPAEPTANDTSESSDSESEPYKSEEDPTEAMSVHTSDSDSDSESEPAKNRRVTSKSRRLAKNSRRSHSELAKATCDDTSKSSDSESEPDKKIQKTYKCKFCPKVYTSCSGRSRHAQVHHSQHLKKVRGKSGQDLTAENGSDTGQGDDGTPEGSCWPPKGFVIPPDTPSIKRVSNKLFTYKEDYQFEGTDFGFKCLSCPFLTKFATGPLRYAWQNIVDHIKEWHSDATRRAAKKTGKPQWNTIEVAPNRFIHGGIPFTKLGDGEYKCDKCGFWPVVNSQKSMENIINHIGHKHLPASKVYMCEICGKQLKSSQKFRLHKLLQHEITEEQFVSCSECDRKFKSKGALDKHTKRVHGGEEEKKIICEVCGKRFSTAMQLEGHTFSHTGVRTFKCQECGKMFGSHAALTTHRNSHRGKKYTCDICGMKFTQHYSVTRHKKTAHP